MAPDERATTRNVRGFKSDRVERVWPRTQLI